MVADQPPCHGVDLGEGGVELLQMATKFLGTHLLYHLLPKHCNYNYYNKVESDESGK